MARLVFPGGSPDPASRGGRLARSRAEGGGLKRELRSSAPPVSSTGLHHSHTLHTRLCSCHRKYARRFKSGQRQKRERDKKKKGYNRIFHFNYGGRVGSFLQQPNRCFHEAVSGFVTARCDSRLVRSGWSKGSNALSFAQPTTPRKAAFIS